VTARHATQSEVTIDLLVRDEDGSGYVERRITAVEGGLRFRPCAVPSADYEVNTIADAEGGPPTYLLRHRATGRIVGLSERGWYAFQRMDGRASVLDMVTSCFLEFGLIEPEEVWRTLGELRRAGLVTGGSAPRGLVRHEPTGAGRAAGCLRRARAHLGFRLRDADGLARAAYALGGRFAFTSAFHAASLMVIALGVSAAVGTERWPLLDGAKWAGTPWWAAAALLMVVLPGHELAHALACVHFGRRVRAVGLRMLFGVLPVPYADVTEVWMAGRRARMAVYFYGPLSTLLMACVAALLARALGPTAAGEVAQATAEASLVLAAIALWPFLPLPTDGYQLLANQLGCLSLREDAFAFVRRRLSRELRAREGLSPRERTLLRYAAMTAGSTLALVAAVVWMAARALAGGV
jgi:putative peptide zinc metalloprotease protein